MAQGFKYGRIIVLALTIVEYKLQKVPGTEFNIV